LNRRSGGWIRICEASRAKPTRRGGQQCFLRWGIPVQGNFLKIPFLPLRPGVYTLVCSIFNHGNDITEGRLVDSWHAVLPLVVDTTPLANPQERWAGVMNIPAELEVTDGAALIPSRQGRKD
jgi:hypothetical protein